MNNWRRSAPPSRYVYYTSSSTGLKMVTSLDPEFGSHVFQIYARNERNSIIPLSFYNSAHQSLFETDLVEFGTSISYYIWKFYSSQGLLYETARATGVIVLLGLGSILCYRLLKFYFQKPPKDHDGKNDESSRRRRRMFSFLWEEELLDDENEDEKTDPRNLKGKYFGPLSPDLSDNEASFSIIDDTTEKRWDDLSPSDQNKFQFFNKAKVEKQLPPYSKQRVKRRKGRRHVNQSSSPAPKELSEEEEDSFSPERVLKMKRSTSVDVQSSKSIRTSPDGASYHWSGSDINLNESCTFGCNYQRRNSTTGILHPNVFSKYSREQSIDSFCSDMSLDIDSPCFESSAMMHIDELESALNTVKDSVLTIDADLESLQTSRHCLSSQGDDVLEIIEPFHPSPVITLHHHSHPMSPRKTFRNLRKEDLGESTNSSVYPSPKSQCSLNGDNISLPSLEWDHEEVSEYPECEVEEDKQGNRLDESVTSNGLNYTDQFGTDIDYNDYFPISLDDQDYNFKGCEALSQLSQSGTSNKSQLYNMNHLDPKQSWSSEESGYIDDSGMVSSNDTVFNQPLRTVTCHNWASLPKKSDMNENAQTKVEIRSIGEAQNVVNYGVAEWQGHTDRAALMKQGYELIPSSVNCSVIRVVRGDNYCALRAVLFQILRNGYLSVNSSQIMNMLGERLPFNGWLQQWKFNQKLNIPVGNFIQGAQLCLMEWNLVEKELHKNVCRDNLAIDLLNSSREILLLESLKLLMIHSALHLFDMMNKAKDIPLFATLMFCRDSSCNPENLMKNHLNHVGDTAGIEQIEMFLLSYSLKVTIRVVRISKLGTSEYISIFSGEESPKLPIIDIISEDDRHYNVIL